MDLEEHKKLAKQKHKEQLKTLAKLKKNPPKNLDVTMQTFHEEVFEQIDCLQCANCCTTTGPFFTDRDINRIAKLFRLKEVDFIAKYLRIDEDGDHVLQQTPCAFLGEDNYCSIYEDRPKACREFPHTDRRKFYQINDLTIKNCKVCPAAFEVVDKLKNIVGKTPTKRNFR